MSQPQDETPQNDTLEWLRDPAAHEALRNSLHYSLQVVLAIGANQLAQAGAGSDTPSDAD